MLDEDGEGEYFANDYTETNHSITVLPARPISGRGWQDR